MTLVAQRANLASQVRVSIQTPEVHTTLTDQNVGLDADREGRHTNLGSAHNPSSTAERRITSTTKSVGSEVQQILINPTMQRVGTVS